MTPSDEPNAKGDTVKIIPAKPLGFHIRNAGISQ